MPFDLMSFMLWLFAPLVAVWFAIYVLSVPILGVWQLGRWILQVARR